MRSNSGWGAGFFRPRLEILELRLYPGDTILGLGAVILWGQTPSSSSDEIPGATPEWGPALDGTRAAGDSLSLVSFVEDSPASGERRASAGESTATASTYGSYGVFDSFARSAAFLPTFAAAPVHEVRLPVAIGGAWSGASASFFALTSAGGGEHAGSSPGLLAGGHPSSAPLAVDHTRAQSTSEESFDASSGQLVIRPAAGEQTVREAITADGFLDVTMAGQKHSSNPRSASFDRALAGATGATLAGIRFAGGGQDTLILGSQQVAGGMTIQATGATVVTETVATAGPLAIQAANVTVNGALRGSGVSLAASGWVIVNAAGRIDAVPAQGRPSDPSTIALSADVFVNSGQLHADGRVGGQINVQARNILNAGPITANGAAAGGAGGQVRIAFTGAYVATTAAVVSADSAAGPGGHLTIDGGSQGHLFTSGRHQATGSVGGAVDLFGRDIVLSAATVDASGQAGGGAVRIGGDFPARERAPSGPAHGPGHPLQPVASRRRRRRLRRLGAPGARQPRPRDPDDELAVPGSGSPGGAAVLTPHGARPRPDHFAQPATDRGSARLARATPAVGATPTRRGRSFHRELRPPESSKKGEIEPPGA